ncbi:PspA/IM30 family protein [Niallia sp. 03091]|uniref:PspA/IM30 family protein n=1 Tax=unclassified Niallia TaxID=2837522 RepID=UPI004044F7BB
MTSLLKRIKNSVAADINEILDKKENKNPISLLNQYLKECEKETEKVKKLVERQYKLKEEFTKELQQAEELANKRNHQAAIAEKAGEEELLQFALLEKNQYEERSQRLKESIKITEKQLIELETKYIEMTHKLKDMNIRRLEMMGKENITHAHVKMNKVLDEKGINDQAASNFEEIEKYIDSLEQKINTTYYQNTIDAKIAKLEKDMDKSKEDSLSS